MKTDGMTSDKTFHTNGRKKSYLKARLGFASMIAILLSILICTSCRQAAHKASYRTTEEAVNDYAQFLVEVKKRDKVSMESLLTLAKQWRQTNDTVVTYLERDSSNAPHRDWSGVYRSVHEKLREEFQRLVMSRPRTLVDVVNLKAVLSTYAGDADLASAKAEAMPFFAGLDSVPIYNKGVGDRRRWSAASYEAFLDKTLATGVHSKADLLRFIKTEDFHFRNFLARLSETETDGMGDITRKTERCCLLVLQSAANGELTYKDAMVYLSMRTNRRLLLNARTCIDDIRRGKVKTETQAQAYFWMLLQSYTSIDGIGMALLTEKDRADFISVSADAPQCIGRLARLTKMDEAQLKELPHLFMKVIVATY